MRLKVLSFMSWLLLSVQYSSSSGQLRARREDSPITKESTALKKSNQQSHQIVKVSLTSKNAC